MIKEESHKRAGTFREVFALNLLSSYINILGR